MRTRRRGGQLARLVRRFVPDGNPLRRTVDRIESLLLIGLMAAFLAGAPLAALAAGSWSAAATRAAQRSEAGWQPVRAVVLSSAGRRAQPLYQGLPDTRVPARWTAPDGKPRVGRIYVSGRPTAGRVVTIWTNRAGRIVGYPLQHTDVVLRALLAGSGAVVAVAAVLGGCWLVIRRLLDRRRLAAWDMKWAATGPEWMRRP